MTSVRALAAIMAAAAACACQRPAAAPPREVVVWRQVGSWSGHGNAQTESFTSDTGGFRVRWKTTNPVKQGAGSLKVVFRSGDSGRPIIDAVDVVGAGDGVEEVADNVRWYFLTIESKDVDWSVSVDERLRGHTTR
ncbi:MAG TPA: hypothetical protein VH583_09710 [Vicinamibacterales bacterium]|jgi:hypothetical protein